MSVFADNPFEPPSPASGLPIDRLADREPPVTSVTFRYSHPDVRRASTIAIQGRSGRLLIVLGLLIVGLGVLLKLAEGGLPPEFLGGMVIGVSVIAAVAMLWILLVQKRGGGPSEAPFDTTFELSPAGLLIRDEGISEIRRSWSAIAGISEDQHLIRFEFLFFNTSSGRFITRPGQFLPIRAFDTEEDAASFLATARAYRVAAGPTITETPRPSPPPS